MVGCSREKLVGLDILLARGCMHGVCIFWRALTALSTDALRITRAVRALSRGSTRMSTRPCPLFMESLMAVTVKQ